mmetsp:Transcript_3530/g.7799  ORF Transcript_3530/g.7799 Transcript_3530/m.7799 type:complete len:207 (+) Transcript_3530:927-1547(+)
MPFSDESGQYAITTIVDLVTRAGADVASSSSSSPTGRELKKAIRSLEWTYALNISTIRSSMDSRRAASFSELSFRYPRMSFHHLLMCSTPKSNQSLVMRKSSLKSMNISNDAPSDDEPISSKRPRFTNFAVDCHHDAEKASTEFASTELSGSLLSSGYSQENRRKSTSLLRAVRGDGSWRLLLPQPLSVDDLSCCDVADPTNSTRE